jgi:phage-related protein (TIGR01555 family)
VAESVLEYSREAAELLKQRIDSAISVRRGLSEIRSDSYWNLSTGVGGPYDKRVNSVPTVEYLDYQDEMDLYRGNDMAARIIDSYPEEMCRRGWFVTIQDKGSDQLNQQSVELSENVASYVGNLNELQHVLQALKWARAFGGAGIFVGANDGQAADRPLNYNNIKSIDFLLTLDRMELVPNSYYTDYRMPNYGFPETYRLNRFGTYGVPAYGVTYGKGKMPMNLGNIINIHGGSAPINIGDYNPVPIIHESRILRFEGVIINRLQLRQQFYWGDSILVRVYDILRDFDLSWESAAILLQDFAQAVIKLPGFAALLAKEGPTAFAQAAGMVERSRSTARAMFLDKEDEFERKATPVTGLPELLLQFSRRLAAAADMPMSRLMGDSPRGFNASGETDETWWYDKIAAQQRAVLIPVLKHWYKIVFACKNGPTSGQIPELNDWRIHFHPLKQLSDLQEADRRFRIGQTDAVMVGAGVFTPEEIALTRSGGDDFNGGKIQLLQPDPKKRQKDREDAMMAAQPKGAIGGGSVKGSTQGKTDKRKVEVHLGTGAGGNIPPVSGGSGKENMEDSYMVAPGFVSADPAAPDEKEEILNCFKRVGKDPKDWDFEILRNPAGKMVGIYMKSKPIVEDSNRIVIHIDPNYTNDEKEVIEKALEGIGRRTENCAHQILRNQNEKIVALVVNI